MGKGPLGAAMIAWAQSHIDGIPALKYTRISEGLSWRWQGAALPLAGNRAPLILGGALNQAELKAAMKPTGRVANTIVAGPEFGSSFVVTDGERAYSGLPVSPAGVDAPLLVFHDRLPPSATDLTILKAHAALSQKRPEAPHPALSCFTPGTLIETDQGPVAVEDLGPGDRVLTRDSGAQEIVWMGHRRMSGARLYALPRQRPVLIRVGALGVTGPQRDLRLAPDTRILLRAAAAADLWGETEVLARVGDLVGCPGILWDGGLNETYYIHLMLKRHEVIRANGIELESFHPGLDGMHSLTQSQRSSLAEMAPDLVQRADIYGAPVRRLLTRGEVDLFRYAMARRRLRR